MDLEPYKIICNGYPTEFILDKNVAKDYFKQFGKLKRLTFRTKVRICTVEYADEEGFLQALNNAGEYKGITFTVSSFGENTPKSGKKPIDKKQSVWVDTDEIEAELAAMSGYTPNMFKNSEGTTSPSSKFEKVPKLKRTWKNESIISKKAVKPKSKENLNVNIRISGEEVDLVNLVLSQATGPDDKYRILDAKDKLIKIKLKKLSGMKSGATIGTCPDMCPEKERLFREIKHQVAWYEQEENDKSMNHNKAIKQYSRSSADQEAPLAHELRPVSVLQMTMGYFLHNIIDLCDTDEVHIGEWFHFLWDRTRGIRKDITQQELCSQGAVELVEQCARFHIHCSARLVAEDPSVFDQKINTENLTKCLQTLKYMYHDLLLKGESCEKEAEFRAYIILLNLNDGNFMWEVQQLRTEIQRSKEVRFALQVHSAIDKNNYVLFFKLVNSTTYLNACILMRYFVQVRVIALKTLLKCYIPRAAKTTYPLVELQTILAFDDIESTMDFLQYHGLSLNDECSHVILDKISFISPDFPYILDRSMVVEDKRALSVGRIICGKDLPPKTYLNHKIQNSFDNKGYLTNKDIVDELDLEKVKLKLLEELKSNEIIETEIEEEKPKTFFKFDQKDPVAFSEKEEKIVNPFTNRKSGSIFATKEAFPPTEKNIFAASQFNFQSSSQDVPDFGSKNIFSAIPDEPKSITGIFPTVLEAKVTIPNITPTNINPMPSIFSTVPDPPKKGGFSFNLIQPKKNVQPIVTTTIIECPINPAPQIDLEKERKEKEEIQKKIDEEKKLELKKQQEQMKLLEAKQNQERKKRRQEEELQKRLEEIHKEEEKEKEIKNAVNKVINSLITNVDNKIREEKLSVIKERIEKRTLIKVLREWKFNVSKNKRKRKVIDCSPVYVNMKTLEQSAEELRTSSQDLTLTLMKRYKYGKPLDVGILLNEEIETVDIHSLTYSILKNRIFELTVNKPKQIFWKVVVSLPDKSELTTGLNRIEETMDSAFPWKKSNGKILYLEHLNTNPSESITYCIEKQQGFNVNGFDSNGIIFVAKNFNTILQRRIFENLKGFGVYTKVPIVIILQEYDRNDCKLETLIKENIVSDYVILVENAVNILKVVEEGLIFLAKKVESSPPLELDSLKSFMTKYLCSEIWKRANSFSKWNSNYKKCLQNPNLVIGLYNEGLSKLKSIILNESNKEYAVFPEEFKKYLNSETPDFLPCSYRYFPTFWKSKNYLNKLDEILRKLSLPKWQDVWPPVNEFELEVSVFKYCSKIMEEPDRLFYKVMSLLLQKVDPNLNFEDIKNVLWTDVIEVLGLEKLIVDIIALNSEFKSQTFYEEYFVIYNTNILNDYRFCDWFYIYNPKIKQCVEEELQKPVKVVQSVTDTEDLMIISDDFFESVRNNLLNKSDKSGIIKELGQLNASLKDLTESMRVHKKISSTIDQSLQQAIAEK